MDNVTNLEDYILKKCIESIKDINALLKQAEEQLTPEQLEQFYKEAEHELERLEKLVQDIKGLKNE